jgi:quercetin dioxygenase-like cupin family protein
MIHQLHIPGPPYGIQYTFREAGWGIPMHSHEPELAHNVEVVAGSILLTEGTNERVIRAGQIASIAWANPHQIEALEPATVIRNWMLNGMPEGYDKLPPEELEWEKDIPTWHLINN